MSQHAADWTPYRLLVDITQPVAKKGKRTANPFPPLNLPPIMPPKLGVIPAPKSSREHINLMNVDVT